MFEQYEPYNKDNNDKTTVKINRKYCYILIPNRTIEAFKINKDYCKLYYNKEKKEIGITFCNERLSKSFVITNSGRSKVISIKGFVSFHNIPRERRSYDVEVTMKDGMLIIPIGE